MSPESIAVTKSLILDSSVYSTSAITYLMPQQTGLEDILVTTEKGTHLFSKDIRFIKAIENNQIDIASNLGLKKGNKFEIEGIKLEYIASGSQSRVFKFMKENHTFILKVNHTSTYELTGALAQPYINEMIQLMELQHAAGESLNNNGIFIPEVYLATSNFMITEYVEGTIPEELDGNYPIFIEQILIDCISQKIHGESSLWGAVVPDIFRIKDGIKKVKENNFIITSRGLYLIDAFKINHEEHLRIFQNYYGLAS